MPDWYNCFNGRIGMKTVDYFKINHPKYRLQKKLDEIRHTIISGTQEKLPQLFTELENEQKKFEEAYIVRWRIYTFFKHYKF